MALFSVIIEGREYNLSPHAQTVQNVALESESSAKVMFAFESKPLVEQKQIRLVETVIAEEKSWLNKKNEIEAESALNNPVTKVPIEINHTIPVAVPAITPEEAESRNDFALFLLGKDNKTVVEGEILARSELPDPERSDYPNCRFTVHFRGNAILLGEPCPQEMVLIIEGFDNFIPLITNSLQTGDKVICTIIPFVELPEDFQSTQVADDLNCYHLEQYYVVEIDVVKQFKSNEFMPISGIQFQTQKENYISIFERQINPNVSQQIIDAQNNCIQKDLGRINNLLTGYDNNKINEINQKFQEYFNKIKNDDRDGYNRVKYKKNTYIWRNIDNSFWCLPVDYTFLEKPDTLTAETLDSFSALKRACESNGVQLIISLVPDLYVISSRVINKSFCDIPDFQTATFAKQLMDIDIECIYASDFIIKNYNKYPFAFLFPSDPHPADTAQDVLTDILAERLKRYSLKSDLNPLLFSETREGAYLERGSFPAQCDIGDNKEGECYLYRRIYYNGGAIPKKGSSVMIIGNSFTNIPFNATPSLISLKTNSSIDYYRMGSYGPFSELLFLFLSRPEYFLKDKKVLIMQVGTEHLRTVNNNNTMLNIAQIDADLLKINNKTKKSVLFLQQEDDSTIPDYVNWGGIIIDKRNILTIQSDSIMSVISFNISEEMNLDKTKSLTLLIPSICFKNNSCSLIVNGQTKQLTGYTQEKTGKYIVLCFDLPSDTEEITVNASGAPGTLFSIKEIQIWQ